MHARRRLGWLVLCGWAAGVAAPAQAGPVRTAPATLAPVCSQAGVYVSYVDHGTATYDRCAGYSGNLTSNPANILGVQGQIQSALALDVSYVGLSNGPGNGPFTSDPGTTSGWLVLDQLVNSSFVLGLHGPDPGNPAGKYTLYAFDNPNHWSVASVFFDMSGTSVQNGNVQRLSHAALYAAPTLRIENTPPSAVPEPQSLALLLAAACGAWVARRRR